MKDRRPPLVADIDVDEALLRRLQEAEVTDRHLRALFEGKMAARSLAQSPWTHRLTMVEAIILWWEQEMRAEVLGTEEPAEETTP